MIRFLQNLFGTMLFVFSVCAGEVLLIGTADLHGKLENFSRLAPEISKYPEAIKIDIGDFVQGDFVCVHSQGMPMIKAFNELKFDLFVPGNHEFEFHEEIFHMWRKHFSGKILGTQWRFGKFVPDAWCVIERNNYRIGIVGLGEVAMSKRAKIFAPLHWSDEIEAIGRLMPEIRKAKCDALVLAAHVALKGNFGELYRILQRFPEFDAVIAAHSHKEHPGSIVAKKIAVQPGPFGESAALLRFCFDEKRKLVQIKSELLRCGSEQNREILEIYSRTEQEFLSAAQENLGEFFKSDEFGKFCADEIRKYFKCDAAFFSMNKKFFVPGIMTGKKLFSLMPYGNRICIVEGRRKDFEKLAKKLSAPWRKIYVSEKKSGKNIIHAAMSDHLFLLYQSMNKNTINNAEMIDVFERDVIREALKREFPSVFTRGNRTQKENIIE